MLQAAIVGAGGRGDVAPRNLLQWLQYRSKACSWIKNTLHQHECLLVQAVIAGADGREDGPRWNLLQWLQYWSTRQLAQPDGSTLTVERTKSVNSIDDEADSRDVRRRSAPLALQCSRTE